jgi:hypothetical protein
MAGAPPRSASSSRYAGRPGIRVTSRHVSHVTDLGADGLFIEGASAPVAEPFTVVSPPARPSLLARLLGRLRRH